MPAYLPKKSWLKWLLLLALWTFIGLSFASQLYLSRLKVGSPVSWGFALSRALADWYVFALLSLPALWLARRFRIERGAWRESLAVHALASAGFSILWMVLRAEVEQWLSQGSSHPISFSAAFSHALVATSVYNVLVYWVIVSISHSIEYSRKFQEREFRAAELEKRLAQSKLQALQMQLNPHFLFNTLNSISSLMHKDVEAADRMIALLSDLLRYTLESTDAHEVPLHQELEFLGRYLEIQQTRFGERLQVEMDVAPDTLEARVPNLVLQPLVENAICHGIAPRASQGRVILRAQRRDGWLHLEVRDNGDGLPPNEAPNEGVGLSNTRARLQQLYGNEHQFVFAKAPEGGLAVQMQIPFRAG
jgi:signal transduction histidine kinase